ncbi:50S ribosomal protein L29 [Candidatus Bathyarchaeota archaeon]|nr:50S ribosomal protein L29 [Candidatus Bathyarchaeota archaeon]
MPLHRMEEIRKYTNEEREKKLTELNTELMRVKAMVKAGGSIENPARIKEIRKGIARILTIKNEEKRKNIKGVENR